jgi:hypothetical protein
MTDWTVDRKAQLAYSYERFAQAKVFVFLKWGTRRLPSGMHSHQPIFPDHANMEACL